MQIEFSELAVSIWLILEKQIEKNVHIVYNKVMFRHSERLWGEESI